MSSPERSLVVIRHAKAERVGPTDFERELTPRGHGDAAAVGRWLAEQEIRADAAVVSAATRTRQTWDAVCRSAGWEVAPTLDRGLYAADADTALDILRTVDDGAACAVLLGHNPTVAYLAQLLDNGDGDLEAGNAMAIGFPTSATAVLGFDGSWADLALGTAILRGFHVGRG